MKQKKRFKILFKCAVPGCEEPVTTIYKNVWFCKKHAEDYLNLDKYVNDFYYNRRKKRGKPKRQPERSLHVPDAGMGKAGKHTHSAHTERT